MLTVCRALYYIAYLAEEEYNVPDGETRSYTIAPGCQDSRAVKGVNRCTLKEFLLHIWGKRGDELTAPKKFVHFSTMAEDVTTENISQLVLKINDARTDTKDARGASGKITGNTDDSKLRPSGGDYFDILGEVGGPINNLASSSRLTKRQRRIVERGKHAAKAVVGRK